MSSIAEEIRLHALFDKVNADHPAPWNWDGECIEDANGDSVVSDGEGYWLPCSEEVGQFIVMLVNEYAESRGVA